MSLHRTRIARLARYSRLALFITISALAAAPAEAQRSRRKKKPSVSQRQHKRAPVRSRSPRPASPLTPVAHFTTPGSADALAADLGLFLQRTRSGQWGVMVTSVSRGDTLFRSDAGTQLRPASTMKLLTSALALERFGPGYQFSTDVLRSGTVGADGTLTGNLILRGDGDPSLSGRFMEGGTNAPMDTLAQQVAAAGIRRVSGDVIGDASAFDSQLVPDGWLPRYLGAAYAARVSGLSLNENVVWVAITPGARGGAASVALEPATTAIPLIASVRTVSGGGSSLRLGQKSDGTIQVRGTIGVNSRARRYSYVVADPATFATGALRAALAARGISVSGATRLGVTPAGAVKIASLQSPELARIISAMDRESINIYAELLFRDAARGPSHEVMGTAANARAHMRSFFRSKIRGSDPSSIYNADGSGLSSLNRVTARAMVQLLSYAHSAAWGPQFHAALPVAGESGTQRRRMRGSPAAGNLHAKTGTTDDVVALAGYVTARNGELLAFAFLYNGADRWNAKATMDIMGETLASFAR